MSATGKNSQQKKSRKGRFQIIPRTWYRADPPPFNPQPWNKIVLELNYTGLTSTNYGIITIANVVNTIRDQSGADVVSGAWWLFRFHGLAAWEMEGNPLEIVINDLDRLSTQTAADEDFQALRTLSDIPARNHWAHVCFVWPRDNRNNTYSNRDAATLNIATIKANNDEGTSKVRVYLKVLWRTSNVNTPGRSITFSGPDAPGTNERKEQSASRSEDRRGRPLESIRRTSMRPLAIDARKSTRQDKAYQDGKLSKTSKHTKYIHKSCDTLPTNEEEADLLYRRWDEELSDSE